MDYEKAYKEAMEKLRSLHDNANEISKLIDLREELEDIFPELAESDGEQHRKWIIEYLYDGLRKSDEQFKDHFKAAIAWFEKQADQKLKFRIGDTIKKKGTGDIVTICEIDLKNREYRLSNTGFIPFKYEYLWELVEQKPAEWSEDDQSNFCELRSFIVETYRAEDASRLITWLNDIKDRVQLQPKQEWSEEDKKLINDTCHLINTLASGYGEKVTEPITFSGTQMIASIKDRLSALVDNRPQNTWRPSREQIIALRWVLNNVPYNKHKEEISGLIEQIKDFV